MLVEQFIKKLKTTTTEEEVKHYYSKWLGIDIKNKLKSDLICADTLFEFKYDKNMKNIDNRARILAQALSYFRRLQTSSSPDASLLPTKIVCADKNEAFIVSCVDCVAICRKTYQWHLPPSRPDINLINDLKSLVENCHVYDMTDRIQAEQFKSALQNTQGKPIKRLITFDNFEEVYELWKEKIGYKFLPEAESVLHLLFLKDIGSSVDEVIFNQHNGYLTIIVHNKAYKAQIPIASYQMFWESLYERPPEPAEYARILACADRLLMPAQRRNHGAFYTPLSLVRRQMEVFDEILGVDWQDKYYVWDPCCGTGNLTYYMQRFDQCFLSTLEESDINIVKQYGIAPGACAFQYDFLNDDIDYFQRNVDLLDNSVSWKLPERLRKILKTEPEKLLILMNPPFASPRVIKSGDSSVKVSSQTKMYHWLTSIFKNNKRILKYHALRDLQTQFVLRAFQFNPKFVIAYNTKLIPWITQGIVSIYGGFVCNGTVFSGINSDLVVYCTFLTKPHCDFECDTKG